MLTMVRIRSSTGVCWPVCGRELLRYRIRAGGGNPVLTEVVLCMVSCTSGRHACAYYCNNAGVRWSAGVLRLASVGGCRDRSRCARRGARIMGACDITQRGASLARGTAGVSAHIGVARRSNNAKRLCASCAWGLRSSVLWPCRPGAGGVLFEFGWGRQRFFLFRLVILVCLARGFHHLRSGCEGYPSRPHTLAECVSRDCRYEVDRLLVVLALRARTPWHVTADH